MKAKKRKARTFWIVESTYYPILYYTKKEAVRDLRVMNDEYHDAKAKLIKVTEQLPKRRGK